jgi:hypothetical protein
MRSRSIIVTLARMVALIGETISCTTLTHTVVLKMIAMEIPFFAQTTIITYFLMKEVSGSTTVTIRCTLTMAAALATDSHGLVSLRRRSRRRKLLFAIPKMASAIEHCAVAAGRICQELQSK